MSEDLQRARAPEQHESVLERCLCLSEVLDLPTFNEVVKSFVDLYKVGIKVFDEKGTKLADVKMGNGDFCGHVFSFPQGRLRCTTTVSRLKEGPVAPCQGARLPNLGAVPEPRGTITMPCFTGLRYLVTPILWEGDAMGRIIFGPFAPEKSGPLPDALSEIPGLDLAQLATSLVKIRRASESTIAKVMAHFAQILEALVAAGRRCHLTSQMHLEAMLEINRELESQNRKLEEMNSRLKEMDRLKSSFLATVSHELRTPLTSIIGYSEMLAEGLAGPLNEEQMDYVRTIMDKGDTLLRLISSILDISQIEAGKVRVNFEPLDLTELVASEVGGLQPLAQKKQVTLEVTLPPGGGQVFGDRDKLRQVVASLLSNAVKFTPRDGRVCLRLGEIGPQQELGTEGYRIIVEDSGVGIPADQLEKIFQSFYQVDGSSTREYGGAGLGLTIVKSFVEVHGGVVLVSSTPGAGSRFEAVLPVRPLIPRMALPSPPPPVPDRF